MSSQLTLPHVAITNLNYTHSARAASCVRPVAVAADDANFASYGYIRD